MRKFVSVSFCLALSWAFFSTILFSQTPLSEAARQAEIPPAWPGCDPRMGECTKARMEDFIAANLQIPLEAKAENAGGVVIMEFVVEKNGLIGEVKPVHDPGLGLATEATRIIELMKTKKIKWIPAEQDGKKIAYRYTTPVSFNVPLPPKEKKANPAPAVDSMGLQVYDVVEVMPMYAGCDAAKGDSINCTFMKVVEHVRTNLKYPEEAIKNNVQGQVVVEFVIDPKGNVTNTKVLQGIGHGCDEEALRVVSAMPAWIPGKQSGKPVAVKMKLPVLFQPSKKQ